MSVFVFGAGRSSALWLEGQLKLFGFDASMIASPLPPTMASYGALRTELFGRAAATHDGWGNISVKFVVCFSM